MKRVNIILIILLALGTGQSALCQKTDTKEKVKSIIVTEEKADMLVKKQYTESETYFDQKGNVIEEIIYKQGKVDTHFKYQYDENNNKIKEEEFDTSGKLKESSEYKYDNGRRIEKTVYDSNKKIKTKKFYKYTTY
jgi:antitoxin component YwqK of YwqJK toxin-antitoxin module